MDDQEFFDTLYQGWSKTTGAESMYWMPEEDEEAPDRFSIIAVGENESRIPVAAFLTEDDAAWITALHGCFGDLVRRLHQALDEADRMEYERDTLMCEIADLSGELNRLAGREDQPTTLEGLG